MLTGGSREVHAGEAIDQLNADILIRDERPVGVPYSPFELGGIVVVSVV